MVTSHLHNYEKLYPNINPAHTFTNPIPTYPPFKSFSQLEELLSNPTPHKQDAFKNKWKYIQGGRIDEQQIPPIEELSLIDCGRGED